MLGQLLHELSRVDEWIDAKADQAHKDTPLAQASARIGEVSSALSVTADNWLMYVRCHGHDTNRVEPSATLHDLAYVAIMAILTIQHFTKDESRTGAVILDETQAILRRVVEDKIAARKATAPLDHYVTCGHGVPRNYCAHH